MRPHLRIDGPRVLPFRAAEPLPIASCAKLFEAIRTCDREREADAWRELAALGISVTLDPARWGKRSSQA